MKKLLAAALMLVGSSVAASSMEIGFTDEIAKYSLAMLTVAKDGTICKDLPYSAADYDRAEKILLIGITLQGLSVEKALDGGRELALGMLAGHGTVVAAGQENNEALVRVMKKFCESIPPVMSAADKVALMMNQK